MVEIKSNIKLYIVFICFTVCAFLGRLRLTPQSNQSTRTGSSYWSFFIFIVSEDLCRKINTESNQQWLLSIKKCSFKQQNLVWTERFVESINGSLFLVEDVVVMWIICSRNAGLPDTDMFHLFNGYIRWKIRRRKSGMWQGRGEDKILRGVSRWRTAMPKCRWSM